MNKLVAKLDRSMLDEDDVLTSAGANSDDEPLVDLSEALDCPIAETYPQLDKLGDKPAIHAVARLIAARSYKRPPSSIRMEGARLRSLIRVLKAYGDVEIIYAASYVEGAPMSFLLQIGEGDRRIFLGVGEIDYLGIKEYPEYKDDILGQNIVCVDDPMLYFHPTNSEAYKLADKIRTECAFEYSSEETYVEMIISTMQGLTTQKVKFDLNYKDSDLDLHYGDGFQAFHKKLVERVASRDKGIVMFHGPPGTGKTHYIRKLLPDLSEAGKRVILIPKHVLGALESPSFNHFMLRNFVGQKIVFVIEDSESIISKREASGSGRTELVSTLLNVTDGLLNDIFSIQVILTFNTDLKSIDDALLRKGRLIAKYQFGEIDMPIASRLAKHLGVELPRGKTRFTLAEIYALREAEEDDILINQNLDKIGESIGF